MRLRCVFGERILLDDDGRMSAGIDDFRGDFLQKRAPARGDGKLDALSRKLLGDPPADARARARHQRGLVAELQIHVLLLRSGMDVPKAVRRRNRWSVPDIGKRRGA